MAKAPRCIHCDRPVVVTFTTPQPVTCLDCVIWAASRGLDPDASWWRALPEGTRTVTDG
jgi:hypothetical protein